MTYLKKGDFTIVFIVLYNLYLEFGLKTSSGRRQSVIGRKFREMSECNREEWTERKNELGSRVENKVGPVQRGTANGTNED